jgi:nucleoside transporter
VSKLLYIRLSAMMFLHYFAPGASMPLFSLYLMRHLGFEPWESGVVMAMPGLAALVSPFIVARIADHYIGAERLLGVMHLVNGLVMLGLYQLESFTSVAAAYFVYALFLLPTFALTNTVAFHHIQDTKRHFGLVRVWGTIGWIAVAWAFGYFWIGADETGRLPHALLVTGFSSCVLGVYAFTLPTVRYYHGPAEPFPLRRAFGVLWGRSSLRLLCCLSFFTAIVNQFYYFGMGPFLKDRGVPEDQLLPVLSVGQFGEVLTMFSLGLLIGKLGLKRVLLLGVAAQLVRYVVFAWVEPMPLTLAGIFLHGACFSFFFTAGYIYIDSHTPKNIRAGTQQLANVLLAGCGPLFGSYIAGQVAQHFGNPAQEYINFQVFWMVPATIAAAIIVVLALRFQEEPEEA